MTLLQRLPNILTASRILFALFFLLFIFSSLKLASVIALAIFIVASLTDYYDGKLARKLNVTSKFGAFLDPLADKILIMGAFISFVSLELIPAWMVIIILAREFMITGLRLLAAGFGGTIPASRLAKHKTVSQVIAVYLVLISICLKELSLALAYIVYIETAMLAFMYLTVLLTLASGLAYLYNHKDVFGKRKSDSLN
ncbi:MAG: CDP-diacylglycerol--glycerol-3-phosphate 3-phosphatidyltransferase [Candidatus Kaelpia aquatica]|nr:CDP-diacylglycerol--glycerol-3-phosphate 3-phosphatidyltransferase [Candidatus Kaelpia aquatica]